MCAAPFGRSRGPKGAAQRPFDKGGILSNLMGGKRLFLTRRAQLDLRDFQSAVSKNKALTAKKGRKDKVRLPKENLI